MQGCRLLVAGLLSVSLLAGCGLFGSGRDDAALSESERLRLPPDLSAEGVNESMAIPRSARALEQRQQTLLATPAANLQAHEAGGLRWLTVRAPAEQVWQWLHDYLQEYDVGVAREVPRLGLVETEPLLQGSAIPRGIFAPRITEAAEARVADVYQFRLETGQEAGATDLYVVQRRLVAEGERWSLRASDPFLEAEMLRGFMAYLGLQRPDDQRQIAAAEAQAPRAELSAVDGQARLLLVDSFYEAWRRVGMAIDRLGFTLEDRNRAEGQYFIRYDPRADQARREKGFFESLAFWRSEPDELALYVIQLAQSGRQTLVTVTDEAGELADAGVAERILALLYEQIR
jgi:outer membrane protein assembly factor BamC